MLNRWLIAALAALSWTFASVDAEACSCMRPPPAEEALAKADAVFIGNVESIVNAPGPGMGRKQVKMEVSETFKGDLDEVVTLFTQGNSAACGFPFDVDTDYLVYAYRSRDGDFSVSICSRTTPLAGADSEVASLRGMPPRQVGQEGVPSEGPEQPGARGPDEADEADEAAEADAPVEVEKVDTDAAVQANQDVIEGGTTTQATGTDASDDEDTEGPEANETDKRLVITTGIEQGEGREDLEVPESDGEPIVSLAAHAMLRYTMKLDARDEAELYNLRLYLMKSWDDFRFYAEPRFRQGPFRNFSSSNFWIQQAWGAWNPNDAVTLRAGLIRTTFGRPWDNSWFGNLAYLNGLKIDPDYGFEVSGTPTPVEGFSVDYSVQWLPTSDGLNGYSGQPAKLGRLNVFPGAPVQIDFETTPGYIERNAFVGRLVPGLTAGDFGVKAGGSIYSSQLAVDDSTGRKNAFSVETELSWRQLSLHGEYIDVRLEIDEATLEWSHLMGGIAYTWNRDASWLSQAQGRVNVSTADYESGGAFGTPGEFLLTAGTYLRIHEILGLTVEYVRWNFDDGRIANRVEWILHAYF